MNIACVEQYSVVGAVASLWTGPSCVWIPVGARDFPLLQNVQAGSVCYPASCSMGTRVFILRSKMSGQGMRLTTYLHLVLRCEWNYTSTRPVCLCGVYRDNFTFWLMHKGIINKSSCQKVHYLHHMFWSNIRLLNKCSFFDSRLMCFFLCVLKLYFLQYSIFSRCG
jgi:hypothetical protein